MYNSTCSKCMVMLSFIMGIFLIVITYPALKQLIAYNSFDTYNCSNAYNFTYEGNNKGAFRASALANVTLPLINYDINSTTDNSTITLTINLRYPGLSTWLPYSFNSKTDTYDWYSNLLENATFECVADFDSNFTNVWGYTKPALPNLRLYYTSFAIGIISLFISCCICRMNSEHEQQHRRRDYIYLN